MNKRNCAYALASLMLLIGSVKAQGPAITSWLQNTTQTGSYYKAGNSTTISNGILVNCQKVEYAADWVYVSTRGIPAYPTGPFQDGNPSQATDQNAIYKLSLKPRQNTGTATATTGGNIGLFINGVALFDYRDGVAWNTSTNALCGGPGNPPCPGGPGTTQSWNRDAIPAERPGFDCSKGHPAMGNYHHHQNPSAFKLDKKVISTVCNLYDADGLYVIDTTKHAPLIGFAYDGFPIYGAYGYRNADGTGGIVRMKSGYQLRSITARTHHADGTDVADGPLVGGSYPLGYFREDYEFKTHAGEADYLDEHNGRFCFTPEYPQGIYCYFATVDANHNSAYPYVVGPTFYGVKTAVKVTTVGETTTIYTPSTTGYTPAEFGALNIRMFPNPTSDILAIQAGGLVKEDISLHLYDLSGRELMHSSINKGQTIAYFDMQALYPGLYTLMARNGKHEWTQQVMKAEY